MHSHSLDNAQGVAPSPIDEDFSYVVREYLATIELGAHYEPIISALGQAGFQEYEYVPELQRMMAMDEMEDFLPDALILMRAKKDRDIDKAGAAQHDFISISGLLWCDYLGLTVWSNVWRLQRLVWSLG
jgi:hypothetical protein